MYKHGQSQAQQIDIGSNNKIHVHSIKSRMLDYEKQYVRLELNKY